MTGRKHKKKWLYNLIKRLIDRGEREEKELSGKRGEIEIE